MLWEFQFAENFPNKIFKFMRELKLHICSGLHKLLETLLQLLLYVVLIILF
jgi:hypothetical protein